MSKRVYLVGLLMLAACGPKRAASADGEKKIEPTQERQKIVNVTWFDVGTCTPRKLDLPSPINESALLAALVIHRPHMLECLVDPAARGPEAETSLVVEATATDAAMQLSVGGANITEAGKKCIEEVGKKISVPFAAKGTTVKQKIEVRHGTYSPSVKMGVNEASDVAGKLRLAFPSWCDCYAEVGQAPPPEHKIVLKLFQEKDKAAEVAVEPAGTPMSTCIAGKVAAMQLKSTSSELGLSYPVLLANSTASEESASAPPELQVQQLDVIRGAVNAEVAMRLGVRANAVTVYDGLVQKYKAKASSVKLRELEERCADMVKSDDLWVDALKRQLAVEQRTLALASKQRAVDAAWTEVETASKQQVDKAQVDVDNAQKTRASDAAVCPKERKKKP